MEPANILDRQSATAPPGEPGLLDQIVVLGQEWFGRAHDQLTLAALETKLAGRSLVVMIAAGVVMAVLVISAWLGLMAAGILWLVSLEVAASIAILVAVAANLVGAALLYGLIRRQSHALRFPATLRSLRPVPAPSEPARRP
ncbi:MAG: phage holin family protein [Betaproteobacteria bacterium]